MGVEDGGIRKRVDCDSCGVNRGVDDVGELVVEKLLLMVEEVCGGGILLKDRRCCWRLEFDRRLFFM